MGVLLNAVGEPALAAELAAEAKRCDAEEDDRAPLPLDDDPCEVVDRLVKQWPTTIQLEVGRRLMMDAIAQSVRPMDTLRVLMRTVPQWARYYRAKAPQYRKSMGNFMRDGDWMHSPPSVQQEDLF